MIVEKLEAQIAELRTKEHERKILRHYIWEDIVGCGTIIVAATGIDAATSTAIHEMAKSVPNIRKLTILKLINDSKCTVLPIKNV